MIGNPPDYPLGDIPNYVPITIMYGQTDAVPTAKDSQTLVQVLRSKGLTVNEHPVDKSVWGHFDFVTGQGAGRLVYDPTIKLLDEYTVWDGPN